MTESDMRANTVWVWAIDTDLEVYATLAAAVREHGIKDPKVELHDDGLRSVRLGGYNNVLVECKVIE